MRIQVDIGSWLGRLGLRQYEPAFRDNAVDEAVLPRLTAKDLVQLGVTAVGHRRKLLDAIASLQTERNPVDAADAAQPPVAAEATAERREVTVLFADLAHYTQLSRELDAEEVHEILGRFFDAADGVVEQYGGTVDKHIGDCVMAVFGAPVAHRDDPERAVRAALGIHKAVQAAGKSGGRSLQVHIGLASGSVVASGTGSGRHRQYTLIGEAANLAARLTNLAGPGETLLSSSVLRHLADRIDAEPLANLIVKDFDAAVGAWRLRGLLNSMPRSRPFVGRRSELAQLESALSACRGTGHGLTVYVRGEAGIGKTRLVEELQSIAAERGFICHAGLVLDFGGLQGRDAVRNIVCRLLGLPASAYDGDAQGAVEAAAATGLIEPDDRAYLNDLLDLPQPIEMRELYETMRLATAACARH